MKDKDRGAKGHPFLFVYGTLMQSFQGGLQEKVGAKLVGEGTIRARLYDLGDYPGARLADNGSENFVKGELYQLSDPERTARILDKYEEYFPSEPLKSLFIRELVTVTLEGGRKRRAWTYLYNRPVDNTKLIPSGDYRDCARRSSLELR
ncbi:MAG TPA: gamma-glutamylcyclotransferase family protein [Terriglobia bacterium]|nr:gamma-glutamylcyclotransferase family protein [Terriglobia bacterium]